MRVVQCINDFAVHELEGQFYESQGFEATLFIDYRT